MRVIDIKESSSKAIPKVYQQLLRERIQVIEDPCMVIDSDHLYYVAHSNNHIGVIENDNKILNCQSILLGENISLGDNSVDVDRMYDDGVFCYRIPEDVVDKVTRCDKNTNNHFSLYKEETETGGSLMIFKQHIGGEDVELRYDITDLDSIESMIEHCLTYTPTEISLTKFKEVLLYLGHELNLYYKFNPYKYEYYRYLINLGNKHYCKSPKPYPPSSLLSSIKGGGFYINIPDDIVDMMLGKNETYNKVRLVTDSYRQHIGL